MTDPAAGSSSTNLPGTQDPPQPSARFAPYTTLAESVRSLRDPVPSYTHSSSTSKSSVSSALDSDPPGESVEGDATASIVATPEAPTGAKDNTTIPLRSPHNAPRFPKPTLYTSVKSEEPASSPKDRLNALLASNASTPQPSHEQPSAEAPVMSNTLPARNASLPLEPMSQMSGPTSATVADSGRPSLDDATASSKDSIISSASSNTWGNVQPAKNRVNHSAKSSQDTSAADHIEPAALIANAGSAEAAIQNLLNERRQTAVRTDQLWRLVEKQRTMVLGLNKDLEKALKDKERYRKKLKESAASKQPRSSHDAGLQDVMHAGSEDFMQERTDSVLSNRTHGDDGVTQATPTSSSYKAATPALSSPGDSKRKPPPARLDLAQSQKFSPPIQPVIVDDDDGSEYGDEEDVIANFDRGRRQTREDDDRYREAVAVEEERQSRSKGTGSKSKSKPPVELQIDDRPVTQDSEMPSGLGPVGVGLPSSPRAALLGGIQSPLQPNVGSIANMLGGRGAVAVAARQVDGTLKSPGLPMSPRPGDRPVNAPPPRQAALVVPQGLAALSTPGTGSFPLTPRAPRQPIPLPPSDQLGLQSPHLARAEAYAQQTHEPGTVQERSWPDVISAEPKRAEHEDGEIFRGLVSEEYPTLLLPPNALPVIDIRVDSSRLRPARQTLLPPKNPEEESVFTLAVHTRADNRQLWRVEKTIHSLPPLEQSLRARCNFLGRLPDRNIFIGHSPAKVDARRAALASFFGTILETPMDTNAALVVCEFLSSDAIGPRLQINVTHDSGAVGSSNVTDTRRRKEGYLAKKGKQLGGWKARYFVLEGSGLRYYEGPNGQHLGSIKLHNAQIAKQSAKDTSEDAEYRHAFMILEPKRKDSSSLVRHVLCAESDDERDRWVEALLPYVDFKEEEPGTPKSPTSPKLQRKGSARSQRQEKPGRFQTVSYDDAVTAEAPVLGTESSRSPITPSPTDNASSNSSSQNNSGHPSISGPVAGGPIQNAQAWGNRSPTLNYSKEKEFKKIFGFKSRTSEDSQNPLNGRNSPIKSPVPSRAIFGMPLAEAAEMCSPVEADGPIPSPVYRCIEYLEAKGASAEEGIFRLSGSNVVIKALKERFNSEGDVSLLDGQYYDVHAVASLLKLYFRELPESILTRDYHLDFLKVLDSDDKAEKVDAINVLVHKLPEVNSELLATLSRFLIEVVAKSDRNKMNVRNVGIVFAPTLNVPAPLISLFLTDFEGIFAKSLDPALSEKLESIVASGSGFAGVEDLRSPRRQMFTDLTTPQHNQAEFPREVHGAWDARIQQQRGADYFQSMQSPKQTSFNPGFTPVRQNQDHHASPQSFYNTSHSAQQPQQYMTQVQDGGFGSLNAALAAPSSGSRIYPGSDSQSGTPPGMI